MASEVEICNMALSHVGVSQSIASLNESSAEAIVCRRFYSTARDATLRDFSWPFATKVVELGLIEEDPTAEWDFSYTLPSDSLHLIRILSGVRDDTHQSRVPYTVNYGDSSSVIYTDAEDAQLEYIAKVTDTVRFPPDFTLALSYRLAMYLAPTLTKGDFSEIKRMVQDGYKEEITRAKAQSKNELQVGQAPESELIRGRE